LRAQVALAVATEPAGKPKHSRNSASKPNQSAREACRSTQVTPSAGRDVLAPYRKVTREI